MEEEAFMKIARRRKEAAALRRAAAARAAASEGGDVCGVGNGDGTNGRGQRTKVCMWIGVRVVVDSHVSLSRASSGYHSP